MAVQPTVDLEKKRAERRKKMLWTEEQYWDMMTEDDRWEFVDGVIIVPSPAMLFPHEELVFWLGNIVGLYVSHHRLGSVFGSNVLVRLWKGRDRVPDLTFVSREQAHIMTEERIEGAPDVVVEVVSPDSARRDRVEKKADYEKAGVREYWLIDPAELKAEFYRLVKGKFQKVPTRGGIFRSQAIAGFWLKLDWLWSEHGQFPDVLETVQEILRGGTKERRCKE